jgi:rhodanese-related sulfurtransferase
MKRGIFIIKILMAFLILTTGLALASGHSRINGAQLESMMIDGLPVVIVDVREPWLYSEGHIPGAINIPYEDNSQQKVLQVLRPDDRIVFVCHGGPMGDELGTILVENGYIEVYNLTGGMRRWRGAVAK